MINIPIKISLPEIWQGEFEKNEWGSVNFIVGANGTGKSLLSDQLKTQLIQNSYNVRLLTAERLSGFEKNRYDFFTNSQMERGLDISNFGVYKRYGDQYGLSASAFVILKERLDIRIKIEALISDLFGKTIRLVEEGGYLKPKIQNISGGSEYVLKDKECHGLKEIITLLTYLYDDSYNCIIFDEPELHLHPQFQSFFLNEIRKLAGNPLEDSSKKLFFIITHSPYFLDLRSLDDLKNILVCHKDQMPTYIQAEDLDGQDEYVLKRFLPRFNTHHKQFFFSPNPVFVEGYTDQQIITLLFEKCGLNIAASGSCVIDVGGKEELAVFYKLCKKLRISCRIIADYDALFRGRLREFFSQDDDVIHCFIAEGLGTVTANIGDIERRLTNIAGELVTKTSTNLGVQNLITLLTGLYVKKSDNINKIKDAVLLSIFKHGDALKPLLANPLNIDEVKAKYLKCLKCIETANICIIPDGELEHYFKASPTDYLNITNKDKLFHTEREYILGLSEDDINREYNGILPLLRKSIPYVDVDIIKHLRYVMVEWIQSVQNAISRKEVKDIATLKTNARVNYSLYSQLFECPDDGLKIENDNKFSCKVLLKASLVGVEVEVLFDNATTAHNFTLKI